ncbi:MAG: ABC-2 family transporter protein [Candidatus Nealsonbacteria bacterium]|nr:ABC-2 family transporter protein [Candidatus Nealsonbacteria bacterium]
MKKYWTVFKTEFQKSSEYRLEFFGHMIMGLFTFAVMVFVFRAIFQGNPEIAGYTFSSVFTYLVMTKFLHPAIRWNVARLLADEIKEGRLSAYLLKPFGVLRYWFSLFWADRLVDILIRLSLIVAFLVLLPRYFSFPGFGTTLSFGLSLVLALFLNFTFNILLSLFAFWVTDIRLFSTAIDLAVGFFAGALVPLDFLPGILKPASFFLPFQYLLYFPIRVFQGAVGPEQTWVGMLISLGWLVALLILLDYFWRKGIKHYEAIGQ